MKKYVITVNGAKYEVVVEEADINAKFTKAETPKAPHIYVEIKIKEYIL